MKLVKIELMPVQDGVTERARMVVESPVGGEWKEGVSFEMVTGTESAARQIMVSDEQRIVISGASSYEIVYDKEQSAAVKKPKDELAEAEEAKLDEQKAAHAAMIAEREEAAKKEREAQTAAPVMTNIGNVAEDQTPARAATGAQPRPHTEKPAAAGPGKK